MENDKLISMDEVARLYGVSTTQLYKWIEFDPYIALTRQREIDRKEYIEHVLSPFLHKVEEYLNDQLINDHMASNSEGAD